MVFDRKVNTDHEDHQTQQKLFETEMDDEQIQIPPMILITFVENSFKYGVSSDTDCTIFIRIIVKEGQLIFETENMIMKENHQNPHAIGIDNCRKRLELLYPNRFVLLTKEENGYCPLVPTRICVLSSMKADLYRY